MSDLYRIKFRSEHFEVELEATDKEFISGNMMRLIEMSTHAATAPKLLQASSEEKEAEAPAEAPPEEESVVEDAEVETEAPAATSAPKKRGRKRGPRKKRASRKASAKKSAPKKQEATTSASGDKSFDPASVASAVEASPHYSFIKEKILNKSNQINRILVSFYFAQDAVDGKGLTTGDVETITEALGNTIKSTNISSQLKKYDDLFITKGERKRGSVVHYKLNAKGKKQLEELLSSAS